MSQKEIQQGPGNLVPDSELKLFLASEAIGKGQLVCLTSAQGTASYAASVCDSDATATSGCIGVAKAAIASGAWGQVYVSGYCPYVLTDGGVTAGDLLVPHSVAGEADTFADGEGELVFGQALSTDTGTVEYCDALIFKRI